MQKKKVLKWYNKLGRVSWLTMIGGIIIFASWIVDKKLQSKWTDQKEFLKRSQLVIDITEVSRSTYELAYYEQVRKNSIDSIQVSFIQLNLARVYLNLLSWSKGRISDDADNYSKLISSKRKIFEDNQRALLANDYKGISRTFNMVAALFAQDYMELDNKYSTLVGEVNDKEDFWGSVFISLYILGSIVLGIAFIIEKTSKHQP